MRLPKEVKLIIRKLERHGYKAYVVGGCVRDFLLGKEPHDYDICTSATPKQIKDCFRKYKTLDVGIKHGTVTVILNEPYEITTFRTDGEYTDGRHPDSVNFVTDLEKDLARRDFTINAMAYNPNEGIIDPFGGQVDLKNKLIRTVGNADDRFTEDALRILRAIRFSAKLDFSIESETYAAMLKLKTLLNKISIERKTSEFLQILKYESNSKLFKQHLDILDQIIPNIHDLTEYDLVHITKVESEISKLTIICYICGLDTIAKLCLTNFYIRTLSSLYELRKVTKVTDHELMGLLAKYKSHVMLLWNDIFSLNYANRINEIINTGIPYRICDLAVNGNDLLALSIEPKQVGEKLKYLIKEVRKDPTLNTKERLLSLL